MENREVLRVLTYNIHGLPWIRCPIQSIFTWIEVQTNADIICFQEVFSKSLEKDIQTYSKHLGWNCFFADKLPCFGKTYLQFHCPSGLCILVKKHISVIGQPSFTAFNDAAGVDNLVTKGIMNLQIQHSNKTINILNTHFQSDFTELPCCRIEYSDIRKAQEIQLASLIRHIEFPVLCGDFNQETFLFFEPFENKKQNTFPQTGEHLDHMLIPLHCKGKYKQKSSIYFDKILLSDHIPVLFSFRF